MNVTRWSPRESIPSLFRFGDIDRFFDEFAKEWPSPRWWGKGRYDREFFPHVDVKDYENEYVMVADLPGVTKDKLDINVTEDRVTLKGCYGEEAQSTEGASFYCQERYGGCFERTITLPGEIKVDGVKATLHDGVLSMQLPKAHTEQYRRIELTEQ